ncbi:MAG: porin [Geminicoccaceae bacterium]
MTKNLLLGSTALVGAVALATPAFADIEVTLSGQVEFGGSAGTEETVDDGTRGYYFFMDSETVIRAEGETDSGIGYAGKVELETDADIQTVNADETALYFWGGFGRAELGRDDGAADNMFVAGEDFQAGTGGIDGDADNLDLPGVQDSSDAAKVTYFTPRIAGFQLGASFTPDTGDAEDANDDDDDIEDHVELGANYVGAFGGADVTLSGIGSIGNGETNSDDLEDWGIGGGVEFGGIGVGAGYVWNGDLNEGDGFTIGGRYGFGAANVSAGYSSNNPDDGDRTNVLVFAADYGLWPGVTLKGDIAFNDEDEDDDGDSTTAGVLTVQLDY